MLVDFIDSLIYCVDAVTSIVYVIQAAFAAFRFTVYVIQAAFAAFRFCARLTSKCLRRKPKQSPPKTQRHPTPSRDWTPISPIRFEKRYETAHIIKPRPTRPILSGFGLISVPLKKKVELWVEIGRNFIEKMVLGREFASTR